MDKETRNVLERAAQRARELLEEDLESQLEGTFDILRTAVVPPSGGTHLTPRELFQREKLVASIEHKQAAGMTSSEAVADFVRDAAFTTLNRFVALKMLEARELVQECISKGEQSAGYREFVGLAPGVSLLPGSAGYRLYVESIFDELSTEIKVLFDRRDSASVIWLQRSTFEALLDILNEPSLATTWGEDETIGWLYQYFNSPEERRTMRGASQSQAPRNSRELAVRNQFFTPRYIVQFLTDNTLGRLWLEMRRGETQLAEMCQFMVRRPGENYEQRPKKDPRDLRLLDPACGSGHFLLYAFDLLETIYVEGWEDSDSAPSEATHRSLRQDYHSLGDLRREIPGLILRHNLYGVDIDPRCAQIAQLALWMRAQRSFRESGIARPERPLIRRANIVIAEAMASDPDLTDGFLAEFDDPALGEHFRTLLGRMNLAGELGLLLQPEKVMQQDLPKGRTGSLFTPSAEIVRFALEKYSRRLASQPHGRRRLFFEDADYVVGLLEVAEKSFDVVLMNPPFGSPAESSRAALEMLYPDSRYDIGAAFVDECSRRLAPRGRLGAIFNRTNWFLTRLGRFRARQLRDFFLPYNVDLGLGVLDAFVETAVSIVAGEEVSGDTYWIRLVDTEQKKEGLADAVTDLRDGQPNSRVYAQDQFALAKAKTSPFSYWLPEELLSAKEQASLADAGFEAKQGLATRDNFRFLRLHWEVSFARDGYWKLYSKGGAYAPLVGTYHLVVDWSPQAHASYATRDGQFCCLLTGQASRYEFRAAVTYSQRTSRFSARVYPFGGLFDTKGSVVFAPTVHASSDPDDELIALCLLLNTSVAQFFFDSSAGASDEGKARDYSQGMVGGIPAPDTVSSSMRPLVPAARDLIASINRVLGIDPTSVLFRGVPPPAWWESGGVDRHVGTAQELQRRLDSLLGQASHEYAAAIGLRSDSEGYVSQTVMEMHRTAQHEALGLSVGQVSLMVRQAVLMEALGGKISNAVLQEIEVSEGHPLYPLPWGILSRTESPEDVLVDDLGHARDLATAVERVLENAGVGEENWTPVFGTSDLRSWCRTVAFGEHLTLFSRSQRAAPVAWQLSTPSQSYSVWLYAHALTRDTLYKVLNDYASPKLVHEQRKLELLRQEAHKLGTASGRKQLAVQEGFVEELLVFVEEVGRVASLWRPHLDDGISLTFAPLWRLMPHHKAWQSELKSVWDGLCTGAYDWSRNSMLFWPERVIPKCALDRSLAITHGLGDVFWEEVGGKWRQRSSPGRPVETVIRERVSPAVKAALKNLMDAPTVAPKARRGSRQVGMGATAEESG